MPTGTTYTPIEVYSVIHAETLKHHPDKNGYNVLDEARILAIVLAESGGNSHALNDKNNDPPGSRDRGWYQFNDHWNPDVPDSVAFDPFAATAVAYTKSNGWKDVQAWHGSHGLENSNIQAAADVIAHSQLVPVGDLVDYAETKAKELVSTVLPWADGLSTLLSNLVDPSWWKRVGIGVLGAIIIIGALIIIFGKEATETVTP